MFLNKKNLAVGRCYNDTFFIGCLSFRVTEEIKGEDECRGGSQKEYYLCSERKNHRGSAKGHAEEKHFDDGAVAVGSKHLFSSLAGYFMISSHMIIIYLKPDTNRTGFFRLFCNFS